LRLRRAPSLSEEEEEEEEEEELLPLPLLLLEDPARAPMTADTPQEGRTRPP